jgi:hypothetical protein
MSLKGLCGSLGGISSGSRIRASFVASHTPPVEIIVDRMQQRLRVWEAFWFLNRGAASEG